jgi:hypothetical protein
MRSLYFAPILALAFLSGCDIVTDPIPPETDNGNGSEGVVRRVLIEDLTGHTCNNCPGAARIALDLQEFYGEDQLVIVGVHGGAFAAPQAPIGDDMFDTDHRTEAGIAYNTAFQVMFWPAGMVSRHAFNGSPVISESAWSEAVAGLIGQPSPFDLWIDTIVTEAGNVSTEIKLHLTGAVNGDHNLVVYLTEDHVVDWQIDSEATPPNVPDYDHRHMLRANLNGTWGEPVIMGSAAAGDTITLNYDGFALDPDWNTANCALVAYVYNVATEEVMQVVERKFEP